MGMLGMIRAHSHSSQAKAARLSDPAAPILLLALSGDSLPEGLWSDSTVWGGEVLLGDYSGFRRVAHLAEARALAEAGTAQAVALSGGCFQNELLREICLRALQGVRVLIHRYVPASGGGLALGQALVAAAATAPG